jgi:hypothetical protein
MAKRKSSGGTLLVLKSRPRKSPKTRASKIAPTSASIYSVHPGILMLQKWIGELKAKTGRTLEEWIRHIRADGPSTEKECREWLKNTCELGGNAAAWLADKALAGGGHSADDTPDGYLAQAPLFVEQMYAGPRAVLRPIHDKLISLARELGDIRICPCKTMVPLYRRHVFAQIKPPSAKRIELGFALGEEPFTSRLRDTGGRTKKDRITHSVAITSLGDIDLQIKRWLREAYERDG